MQQFLSQGKKLQPQLGLQWGKCGEATIALAHAARGAFKGLNHEQLRRLMPSLGLHPSGKGDLVEDATACVP
eukprot:6852164-Lingulodinium_polyedra.AAC.1